jgi:methionyl-tRNA synthetase
MGGTVPQVGKSTLELVSNLNKEVAALGKEFLEQMEAIKIRSAIGKALQVSAAGNKFLQVLSRLALKAIVQNRRFSSQILRHFTVRFNCNLPAAICMVLPANVKSHVSD